MLFIPIDKWYAMRPVIMGEIADGVSALWSSGVNFSFVSGLDNFDDVGVSVTFNDTSDEIIFRLKHGL